MDFHVVTNRQRLMQTGWGFLIGAGIVVLMAFSRGHNALAFWLLVAFAGAFGIAGVVLLVLAWRMPRDAEPPAEPTPAMVAAQVQYLRRALYMGIPAFVVSSVWVAWDLYRLETGAVQRVSVWVPVALLYDYFGFWPSVLFVPVLGAVCLPLLRRKIRRLSASPPTVPL